MSTFLAPSFVFFAPRMFFFAAIEAPGLRAAAGMARDAAAVVVSVEAARGDFVREMSPTLADVWLALRKGELVRMGLEGVPVRDGGLLGRLMAGLSHEEKKSSSPLAGVFVPLLPVSSGASVICTSSGYLYRCQAGLLVGVGVSAYSFASAAHLLASSSLYLTAALLVYLVLGSLLASAADPPCD